MTSGRIIGGDYFNLHTLAHEGPMMYGRILPMFFGTVRFVPNDHGYYLTEFRSYASSTKNTYDATVEPGLTLDLGSVTCEGYATMSPAKKYFAVPGKKLIESWPIPALPEVVQITAHSVPGYCFDGWSGDGGCWPYKPSEDELVFDPPLALEDTNSTHRTVWIAMDDSKAVTPHFERQKGTWDFFRGKDVDDEDQEAMITYFSSGCLCCGGVLRFRQWVITVPSYDLCTPDWQEVWHEDTTDADGWYENQNPKPNCKKAVMYDRPGHRLCSVTQYFEVKVYCWKQGHPVEDAVEIDTFRWMAESNDEGGSDYIEGWPEDNPDWYE